LQVVERSHTNEVPLPKRKNNLYIVKRADSLKSKDKERLEADSHSIREYLVERSQQGDRQAQNELYKLYVGAMYNICRRMMGAEDDAKDVLQEAFIDAFLNVKKLKDAKLFSAWIKRIVINHCLNALKKKRIEASPISEGFDIPDHQDHEQDRQHFVQFEAKKILKAIDRISDGCKIVLNLYLFEGYDHKEIAQILSISESTSKAQYSKAKKKIRKILSEMDELSW